MAATRGAAADGSHEGAAVVAEMARRFQAGDVEGAFDLMHFEIRVEQPASLPHGGTHVGRDGMAAMGGRFAEHWDRTIADPRIVGADDGSVVQVTTQTWTARATGRVATVDVVELFAITDGRISEIRVFQQDTALLLATLDET